MSSCQKEIVAMATREVMDGQRVYQYMDNLYKLHSGHRPLATNVITTNVFTLP